MSASIGQAILVPPGRPGGVQLVRAQPVSPASPPQAAGGSVPDIELSAAGGAISKRRALISGATGGRGAQRLNETPANVVHKDIFVPAPLPTQTPWQLPAQAQQPLLPNADLGAIFIESMRMYNERNRPIEPLPSAQNMFAPSPSTQLFAEQQEIALANFNRRHREQQKIAAAIAAAEAAADAADEAAENERIAAAVAAHMAGRVHPAPAAQSVPDDVDVLTVSSGMVIDTEAEAPISPNHEKSLLEDQDVNMSSAD
jgi:hypothetical protein